MLCVFETVRIQEVTNSKEYSSLNVFEIVSKIIDKYGVDYLFQSLPAILSKQLPYSMVQLSSYETLTSFLYSNIENIDSETKFGVKLFSALISGLLSTVFSQPGDTILTLINNKSNQNSNTMEVINQTVNEVGISGLFLGLKERVFHVSLIVITQLLIYDSVKDFFRI